MSGVSGERDVAILGVGMHPWGKWGRDFTEYGMVAARRALTDANVAWTDIQYVAGADTIGLLTTSSTVYCLVKRALGLCWPWRLFLTLIWAKSSAVAP